MFATFEFDAQIFQGPVKALRSSIVKVLISPSDVDPGVEATRTPKLLSSKFVGEANVQIPIGPRNERRGRFAFDYVIDDEVVFETELLQPLLEQNEAGRDRNAAFDLVLRDAREPFAKLTELRMFDGKHKLVEFR